MRTKEDFDAKPIELMNPIFQAGVFFSYENNIYFLIQKLLIGFLCVEVSRRGTLFKIPATTLYFPINPDYKYIGTNPDDVEKFYLDNKEMFAIN